MPADATDHTADAFIELLQGEASEAERLKYRRYFPERHEEFIGVRMGAVFAAARDFADMELDQIERLLEQDAHEIRAGARADHGGAGEGAGDDGRAAPGPR